MKELRIRVGITGAGGFLGTGIVGWLIELDWISEVRALYRQVPPKKIDTASNHTKLNAIVGDLEDHHLCDRFVRNLDVIIHFASRGYPLEEVSPPLDLVSENLRITANLCDAMQTHSVKNIIFASSGGAIYKPGQSKYSENATLDFRTPYAVAKIAVENLLLHYHARMGLVPYILRISNPYGTIPTTSRAQGFIGIALQRALTRTPLEIWGALDISKDFIFLEDLWSAIEIFVKWPDLPCDIYHVSSDRATSLLEVIRTIEAATHKTMILNMRDAKAQDIPWIALDNSKLRGLTGWKIRYSLEQGVRKMLERNMSNGLLRTQEAEIGL